jgi:hypothetical protein
MYEHQVNESCSPIAGEAQRGLLGLLRRALLECAGICWSAQFRVINKYSDLIDEAAEATVTMDTIHQSCLLRNRHLSYPEFFPHYFASISTRRIARLQLNALQYLLPYFNSLISETLPSIV